MIARSQFGAEAWYSVHVRFRFDDGAETEISQGCARDKIGMLEVWDTVPVRFDPADHLAVVPDLPAPEARHRERAAAADAVRKRADDEKIARAQAEIEGRAWVPGDPARQQSDLAGHRTVTRPGLAWAPIAGQLLPVEASVRPGSGALAFDGATAALLGQSAERRCRTSRTTLASSCPGWTATGSPGVTSGSSSPAAECRPRTRPPTWPAPESRSSPRWCRCWAATSCARTWR